MESLIKGYGGENGLGTASLELETNCALTLVCLQEPYRGQVERRDPALLTQGSQGPHVGKYPSLSIHDTGTSFLLFLASSRI
jgi:hypothetical protein